MTIRTIADMCSDAVRLRKERDDHIMLARCALDELKLVEKEIELWGDDE